MSLKNTKFIYIYFLFIDFILTTEMYVTEKVSEFMNIYLLSFNFIYFTLAEKNSQFIDIYLLLIYCTLTTEIYTTENVTWSINLYFFLLLFISLWPPSCHSEKYRIERYLFIYFYCPIFWATTEKIIEFINFYLFNIYFFYSNW